MSWYEYNDLFDKAQINGKYHLFIFDIKDSRKGYIYTDLLKIRSAMLSKLKELEIERKVEILHTPVEEGRSERHGMLGDLFSIVILRDRLDASEMYEIFKTEKKKLNIPYVFHCDDGFYETDDWTLGCDMYYREYAIFYLNKRGKAKKYKC